MRENDVHPAQVAGLFYPAEADALSALISKARQRARPAAVEPKLVIAPHAGLVYSGAVAASAFTPWAERREPLKRIVIFGPAHRFGFRGLALHPAGSWSTPLGQAPVAADLHAAVAALPGVTVDARPFAGEHSLEMIIVMLQAMLPAPFEILPILVGGASVDEVVAALDLVWGGAETGIAISSDLSHFHDDATARRLDGDTARAIETFEAGVVSAERACGCLAVRGALRVAAERDMRVSGLHLANSGEVNGDEGRVVGYGAFAFEYAATARLADPERAKLLALANAALTRAAVTGARRLQLRTSAPPPAGLASRRAAFVTLTRGGELRGCIGSIAPTRSLADDVVHNAVAAGFGDPRFPGLAAAELPGLDVEVSILSHPRPIAAASEAQLLAALEPDRDGLILGAHGRRALFLPSVWRQLPQAQDFVRHLLAKAGLDPQRWPKGAEAWRFGVESFAAPWREVEPADFAPYRLSSADPPP